MCSAKGISLPANFGIPAYNFNSIVFIRFKTGFLWKRSFVEVQELKMGCCSVGNVLWEISIQGGRMVPLEIVLHHCIHPSWLLRMKIFSVRLEVADAHVIMAVLRQQCCVLASGAGQASHESCGASYARNSHSDSVCKSQRWISFNPPRFYSFHLTLSVDTVNSCFCLKTQTCLLVEHEFLQLITVFF